MRTEDLISNLTKAVGEDLRLGAPASEAEVAKAEARLGLSLPDQVKMFYQTCNGLSAKERPLVVLPLASLALAEDELLPFAVFDNAHKVCFDTSQLNQADQWSIVELSSRFVVTLTMASFWSNKIFAWLRSGREVWKECETANKSSMDSPIKY